MATKQGNGTGTIYRRKDGRFEGAAFLPTTSGSARRVRVYAHSHKEAQEKLVGKLDQALRGIPEPDTSWTVATWLDYWMNHVVAGRNRPLTVRSYEGTIRLHINPLLGAKSLKKLNVKDVQIAINDLLARGKSPRTVQKVRAVLRAALNRAMREEVVFRNVAALVDLPAWERKEIHPWSAEEAAAFLGSVRVHQWFIAYLLLLTYGMRKGEVLGLRWADIDFARDEFHVRQQIQRIDGGLQAGPVKTRAGRRTLPLVPAVRLALLEHAAHQGLDLTASIDVEPTEYATTGLVVTSTTGGPVDPQGLLRTFKLRASQAELRPITIHQTRHTAATLLGALGIPARDAQLILGHANVTTTQQIYQHGNADQHRQAIKAISDALQQPAETTIQPGATVLAPAAQDGRCRQTLPSNDHDTTNETENKTPPSGLLTGVITKISAGTPSWNRTNDLRLRSLIPALLADLPTPVIRALHARAKQHILGAVAVNYCRQTVPPIVSSGVHLADLIEARNLCRVAITETLRRRSFPLSLISAYPTTNMEDAR